MKDIIFKVKPKAVIFDTDNTLYAYEPAHLEATKAVEQKAHKSIGIDVGKFRLAFEEARVEVKNILKNTASSHSRLLYFQKTVEILGFNTQILLTLELEQTYWRTFLANAFLFDGVKEFILDLRSNGIITANITDLTAQIQFRKLIYFGLDDNFDYVVTSEEAGVDKPATTPFEIAIHKMKIEPTEIWMIGDHPKNDIMGANAFGMKTLQKKHKGVKISSQENEKPDLIFEDFQKLRKQINWL